MLQSKIDFFLGSFEPDPYSSVYRQYEGPLVTWLALLMSGPALVLVLVTQALAVLGGRTTQWRWRPYLIGRLLQLIAVTLVAVERNPIDAANLDCCLGLGSGLILLWGWPHLEPSITENGRPKRTKN